MRRSWVAIVELEVLAKIVQLFLGKSTHCATPASVRQPF